MKLNKNTLVTHLKMIYSNGLVPQAVLSEQFRCTALNKDLGFFIETCKPPSLPSLDRPVGVLDLNLFIQALDRIPSDEIDITLENGRLFLQTDKVGIGLLTCHVNYVSTYDKKESLDKISNFVRTNSKCSVPVPMETVTSLNTINSLIKSDKVVINVAKNGVQFVFGDSTQNEGLVNIEHQLDVDTPFSVTLSSEVFVKSLRRYCSLVFTGPDSIIAVDTVEDAHYRYILSPLG